MIVFFEKQLVIIQNTRVGSTYLAKALAENADCNLPPWHGKHVGFFDANVFLATLLPGAQFEYFAVIRHPFSWAASWMKFQQPDSLDSREDYTNAYAKTLSDYVIAKYSEKTQETQHQKLQGIPVGNIFLYEKLGDFFNFLEKRLDLDGFDVSLRSLNPETFGAKELAALDQNFDKLSKKAKLILEPDAQMYYKILDSRC